jgi:hypothetical protein
MNGRRAATSARVQRTRRKTILDSAPNRVETKNHKENAMLRKLSAPLIATALVASPAFVAAHATGAGASTPATTTATTPNNATKPTGKSIKTVKHQHKPLIRHHVVAKKKLPRHVKLSAKPHRQHIVLHSSKTTKTAKDSKINNTGKTNKTSEMTKPSATHG